MGWGLSKWLGIAHAFQVLGALAAAAVHGYLTIRVYIGKLGLSEHMVALELLICFVLGYSALATGLQHSGQRFSRTFWLACFLVCDVLVCAVLLGIITTLAHSGLPVHCAGLTRTDFRPDEKPNKPAPGFTTVRFSDESHGQRGELDRLCGLDRYYYTIAVALIFTYIFTITTTTLRILEKKYTRNTRVSEMLEALERADTIDLKVVQSPSPPNELPRLIGPPPQPPSEGIITRTTSLRSTLTAATSSTAPHAGPVAAAANSIPRRPLPRRPVGSASPSSANAAMGFVHMPSDEDGAEAALVADGMQHQQQLQHHHNHQRHSSRDHHQHQLHHLPRMPMLSEEDQAADSALVSDGMRPSEPMLPPYHPGSRRMSGHASEDNELRLSEYVKGQTRAQEMKDSGRY